MKFEKPMLASDADLSKIRFPVIMQPKVDGVRGMVINDQLYGRSLKQHANKYTTGRFSNPAFNWIDGELYVGSKTATALCRNTTSAVNRIDGQPNVKMIAFDWFHPELIDKPYHYRLNALGVYVQALEQKILDSDLDMTLPMSAAESHMIDSMAELEDLDALWLQEGYEGSIIRDPNGLYKNGRSSVREGGLLRIKRFVEEDAIVLSLVEGNHNGNEAKTNELGRTERSSHQENMIPNGLVGGLYCRDLKTGVEFTVSPGKLDHAERKFYWENQDQLIGKTIKYKCFPIGVKDKPRFPTYQSLRAESDKAS